MIPTLVTLALAAGQPTVPSALAAAADLKLSSTSRAIAVNGATDYFDSFDCPVGLSNSVGLTVRDNGLRTLYLIMTVQNTNGDVGGFVTLHLGDDNSDGTIDSVLGPTGNFRPDAATLSRAATDVLKCYINA